MLSQYLPYAIAGAILFAILMLAVVACLVVARLTGAFASEAVPPSQEGGAQ